MTEKKYIDAEAWLGQCNKSWMNYNLAKKIIAEAPAAPVFGQWIDAAKQLPDEADEYIVMIAGAASPTVLYYTENEDGEGEWYTETEDSTNFYKVTHWMVLPEAPGEDTRTVGDACPYKGGEKPNVCKCRSCGAEIVWVTMQGSGKKMPCDAELIHAVEDKDSKTSFVLPGGIVKRGRAGRHPNGEADFVGYRSHFESCPDAERFRRKEE